MIKYAAFLRGIGPGNPNMQHAKLKEFFESLGFKNVQPIISSGNVVFECNSDNSKELEEEIEKMLPEKLGFSRAVFLRSLEELKEIIDMNPFDGLVDTPASRLNLTFLKNYAESLSKIPYPYKDKGFNIIKAHGGTVFSVHDISVLGTPELMRWLEKTYGKNITTRTWGTVNRIYKKLQK